jgi:hypothetical protein
MQMLLELKEAMSRCHAATDKLFAGIDDWDEKPIDLRHHFGFYFGHLAAFAAVKALREVRTRVPASRWGRSGWWLALVVSPSWNASNSHQPAVV